MPKVIFTEKHYYRPTAEPRVTMLYHPSSKPQTVNEECAKDAEAVGAGEIVQERKTKKKDASGNA